MERIIESGLAAIVALVCGFMLGSLVSDRCWEADLRKRGLMEYDQRTGVLEWKAEYRETEE